jgi:hypothetical protein
VKEGPKSGNKYMWKKEEKLKSEDLAKHELLKYTHGKSYSKVLKEGRYLYKTHFIINVM